MISDNAVVPNGYLPNGHEFTASTRWSVKQVGNGSFQLQVSSGLIDC